MSAWYLAVDCILVSSTLLQNGFQWRKGFGRASLGGCFSVNVGNLKLDRSENISNILLYSEKTETEEDVINTLKLNALTC